MGRVVIRAASTALLCLALAGCAEFGRHSPPSPPSLPSSQPAYLSPYVPPPPTHSESPRAHNANHEDDSGVRESATPGAVSPGSSPGLTGQSQDQPNPQASVTLAGDVASKDRAMNLLGDTEAKLSKIDRNKLSGESATTYDQANDLLKAGRKALTEQDYLAASGFAQKASLLASKLRRTP
jgi:hypothetical protein